MKKYLILLMLGLSALLANAQKENGTVYSDHEAITKTKALWAAFLKGDKEAYMNFFADSVIVDTNGNYRKVPKQEMGNAMDWWMNVKNLTIKDDTPSYPDAIVYKKGGLWVQDWLKAEGIHEKTGINIMLPFHNLYSFNKEGKITSLHQYFSTGVFEEIRNSQKTIENGTIYINHPYIVLVRKLVNAYCAEDIDAMLEFYSKDATFSSSAMKQGEFLTLEEKMKENKATFENDSNITLTQVGYPDCFHYSKDDFYVVDSWWILSYVNKEGKKKTKIPVQLSHTFDKDGKISNELIYFSTNHLQ